MDEVVAADTHQIPVSGEDGDQQFRPAKLQTRGERDGPPVRGMEGVQLHVARRPTGAADAGYDRGLVQVCLRLRQSRGKAFDRRSDAAGGTPDVRDPIHAQEGSNGMLLLHHGRLLGNCAHFAALTIASMITSGS